MDRNSETIQRNQYLRNFCQTVSANVLWLCDGGEKKAKNIQFKTNLPNTKPTLNLLLIPHYLKTAVVRSVLFFSANLLIIFLTFGF